jgi:ABC-type Fe3+/spermidine/putrescine transport system ATPase subunit
MAELEIDRLTLRFGGLTVLDGVSLAVAAGELFALIGPNGAGKTSVLNCVSGIYRGQGEIRFRGDPIAGGAPHEIARLGLARTFQHGELFAQLSVLDNLLTGRHARIRTNPLAEIAAATDTNRAPRERDAERNASSNPPPCCWQIPASAAASPRTPSTVAHPAIARTAKWAPAPESVAPAPSCSPPGRRPCPPSRSASTASVLR